jgi:predicted nucleotidyltransferase component of viral defense system
MATLIQNLRSILDSKDPFVTADTKRIILKEVLQAYVLDYIYNHPSYRQLNFYGGTCLHVVYHLNRLSEDLDFDNSIQVDIHHLAPDLEQHFQDFFGYRDLKTGIQQGRGGILRLTMKFPILFELELSQHRNELLHLKIELSFHHQKAITLHTPVLTYGRSMVVTHFSLETMMAGKMLACLERNFMRGTTGIEIKGRDYYDLLWFMQQSVKPLEEKLALDGEKAYSTTSAMLELRSKIAKVRKDDLSIDLLPLFESRSFIENWLDSFHENFERLVGEYLK